MKKVYMKPMMNMVKVHTAQMIATSIDMYGTNATDEGMSRRGGGSLWDEDDDDEY